MGLLDRLQNFFNGSNNQSEPTVQEDKFKKSMLVSEITNLVDKINKINSFDSSIRALSNMYSNVLEKKSITELEDLKATLSNRLLQLTKQRQNYNSQIGEKLEAAKHIGQKPQGLTDHEFDILQRDN